MLKWSHATDITNMGQINYYFLQCGIPFCCYVRMLRGACTAYNDCLDLCSMPAPGDLDQRDRRSTSAHFSRTFLRKSGNGRHVYRCAWPCQSIYRVGVKHCKCMASLYSRWYNFNSKV